MKKQNILEALAEVGENIFGRQFVDVGVGGSCQSDIDTVLILRKYQLSKGKNFTAKCEKQLSQEVSLVLMTEEMLEQESFWCDKFITMAHKGIEFKNKGFFPKISDEKMRELTKPLIPEAVYRLSRNYFDGKIDQERMIDLLIQYLVTCQ